MSEYVSKIRHTHSRGRNAWHPGTIDARGWRNIALRVKTEVIKDNIGLIAVVILLFWFYLTAFIFTLGAELNSEMEHQTRRDTTVGREQPMGERDAFVADDLGKIS